MHYQKLHLTYLCNLAMYWLRAPWGWHNSGETCSSSVIICQLVVHLLVIVQNTRSWNFENYARYKHTTFVNHISFICVATTTTINTIHITTTNNITEINNNYLLRWWRNSVMSNYTISIVCFFFLARQPPVSQGLLIQEDSCSHSDTQQSVELLWTSDQLVVETSTWQRTTLTTDRY